MASAIAAALSPAVNRQRSLAWQLLLAALGSLFLTASSYIQVPMFPVPMTMQTFAVTLIGAVFGMRLGALTVLAWLIEGAAGAPVFAGGQAGLILFAGPTAGYLVSFPLAAALVGFLVERGATGRRWFLAFSAFFAGNLLSLVMGSAWLATLIGAERAVALGFTPFVLGAILKSALGAATIWRPGPEIAE
jgi:biotin transport system substrate-specific component